MKRDMFRRYSGLAIMGRRNRIIRKILSDEKNKINYNISGKLMIVIFLVNLILFIKLIQNKKSLK